MGCLMMGLMMMLWRWIWCRIESETNNFIDAAVLAQNPPPLPRMYAYLHVNLTQSATLDSVEKENPFSRLNRVLGELVFIYPTSLKEPPSHDTR